MSKEKNTIIVGSAQAVQMLSNFVRAKIISVLLGAVGFGLYSILISTIMLFQQFCSIGVNQAAIKELSESYANSTDEFAPIHQSFLSLCRVLALFGGILLLLLSVPMSYVFFEDITHTVYFIISGLSLLFYSLSQSYYTIFQATNRLSIYARISVISSLFTVVSCALLIYLWGMIGLAFSITAGFGMNALLGYCYSRGDSTCFVGRSYLGMKEAFKIMRPIISRGFFIMLGTFSITFFSLILNAVISRDGLSEVGYYQAAVSIMTQGITIISIILATEFYPRISVVKDVTKLDVDSNDELRMLLVIIFPISMLLMIFAPIVVELLYSSSFVIVPSLIRIMVVTLSFRILWMICGFIILSRGEKYSYFIFDGLLGNLMNFLCAYVGYSTYGLIGLAWGWSIGNLLVSIFLAIVVRKRYSVTFSVKYYIILCVSMVILGICAFLMNSICLIILSVFAFASILYAIKYFGIYKILQSRK